MTIKHNTPIAITLTLRELIDVRCALADQVVANRRDGFNGLADDCNRAFDVIEHQTKDFLQTWRKQEYADVLDADYDEGGDEELGAFMRHATSYVAAAFVAVSLLFSGGASAQEAKAFVPYDKALSACSAKWKESDERAKLAKGQKQDAWQKFRAACVVEQGYVKGAKAPK